MIKKMEIPIFKSEEEEANWWDEHREETAKWMEDAINAGEGMRLSDVVQRARERSRQATSATIEVDATDAARAHAIAARKGVPYETYLKTLFHDALDRDEGTH